MKSITKFYLKTFLLTGIGFSIIMLCLELFKGNDVTIIDILLWIILFGLPMSYFMVNYQIKGLKRLGVKDINEQTLKVHQITKVKSNLDKSELIERLKKSNYFIAENLAGESIELKTPFSGINYGEKILISQEKIRCNEYKYVIESKPKWKTAFIDYGKNLENVLYVKQLIKKQKMD